MKRVKFLTALAVLVVFMVFGAAAVFAGWGWWWNASIDLEGVDLRTAWTVTDDQGNVIDGESELYFARIRVKVPKDAAVGDVVTAPTETVHIVESEGLQCKPDGIETEVRYRVEPVAPVEGTVVSVTVTADGQYVDSATGHFGEWIRLQILVPADHPVCDDD